MARILVIDDEHNIRMMIRLALKHDGHEVELAADGEEGLDKFHDGTEWDLVLLDQRMPGMDGLSVLKELRELDPHARAIMITAFGTVDLAVDAMKSGATDFMRKPFTTDTLRGAVQAALSGNVRSSTQPAGKQPIPSHGVTFGMTTINGYRIEFQTGTVSKIHGGGIGFPFTVRRPDGEASPCTVTLSPVVIELIKAHLDRDAVPGGDRFYQAVCEEALANYLYQNADFPSQNLLAVDELTGGLRRFIDVIVSAA